MKKSFKIFFILFLVFSLVVPQNNYFAPAVKAEASSSTSDDTSRTLIKTYTKPEYINRYGNVFLPIKKADLFEAGYEYGDIVKIKIQGKKYKMPFVSEYTDVDSGTMALVAKETEEYIQIAKAFADFASDSGIAVKNTGEDGSVTYSFKDESKDKLNVSVWLYKKGGYLDGYYAHHITRSNNREDYPALSDAEFANFREVTTTGIGKGVLYRTSSPIDPEYGRSTYADEAIKDANVNVILNLTDSEDSITGYEGYEDTYYSTVKHKALNLSVDFDSEEFKNSLAEGLRYLAQNPGTYAIHCKEGKDRAGYVAALLEMLMGASYEEVVSDYMTTFYNYYGVTKDDVRYEAILNSNLVKQLKSAFTFKKSDKKKDLKSRNLYKCTVKYLKSIGLKNSEIEALKDNLSGKEKRKLIIDTDTGADDASALILAAKAGNVDILGVTTLVGNVGLEQSTKNALMALEVAGVDVPVYNGADTTYDGKKISAFSVFGADGMGEADLIHPAKEAEDKDAVRFILETVKANPGEIELVVLGPATNIAKAMDTDPETMKQVKMIWSMGTAGLGPGNASPVAEFNVYGDAPAYKRMLDFGVPVTIIGLDMCDGNAQWTGNQFAELDKANDIGHFVSTSFKLIREFYASNGSEDATMNCDSMAMTCVLYPEFIKDTITAHGSCITETGESYAQVVFYKKGFTYDIVKNEFDYNVTLVTDADKDNYYKNYLSVISGKGKVTGAAESNDKASETKADVHEEILSYWNDDAPAKKEIVSYMKSITDKNSMDYITVERRIAVFDMDGTVYCETDPNYFDHLLLAHRVLEDEDYKDKASEFEKKVANDVLIMNETGIEPENMSVSHGTAIASSFKCFTPDEFYDYIAEYKKTPMRSYDGMTLGEAFYEPMLQIIDFLEANDFTVYIVSGTDRFIVRGLLKDSKLNLPNSQLIGSDVTLVSTDQGDTDGLYYVFDDDDKVVFGGEFIVKNLKMNKVTVIVQEIGVQPVLSFGNSTGDASMAEYVTTDNQYKSLAFMLCCDDTERENGNITKAEKMYSLCEQYDWVPVSMKNDWKTIYGEGVKYTANK